MNVTLNEVGLSTFFRGPQMERILEPRAEAVRQQALQNASGDVIGVWTGRLYEGVFARIVDGPESKQAEVGTTAVNEKGINYPAWWDADGGRPWLTSALEKYFPDLVRNY